MAFAGFQGLTDQLSTPQELMRSANTTIGAAGMNTGGTAPAHTPEVPAQKCTNVATGDVYEWWAGAWH